MPQLIAHRGDKAHFPENTLAAFAGAVEASADGIELDLQLSKDGQVVIWHDNDLKKAGRPEDRTCELTSAELAALTPDAPIPTLHAVLDAFGSQTSLMLEIKSGNSQPESFRRRELMDRTITAARERQLQDQVFILSFDLELLRFAHQVAPEFRYVLDFDGEFDFSPGHDFLHALSPSIRILTPELKNHGKPVATWTCNDEDQVRKALACGADYILSDDPGWLRTTCNAISNP